MSSLTTTDSKNAGEHWRSRESNSSVVACLSDLNEASMSSSGVRFSSTTMVFAVPVSSRCSGSDFPMNSQ